MILERLMSGQKPLVSAQGMSFFSLTEDHLFNQVVLTPSHFHYQSDGQRHKDKAKRWGEGRSPWRNFLPHNPWQSPRWLAPLQFMMQISGKTPEGLLHLERPEFHWVQAPGKQAKGAGRPGSRPWQGPHTTQSSFFLAQSGELFAPPRCRVGTVRPALNGSAMSLWSIWPGLGLPEQLRLVRDTRFSEARAWVRADNLCPRRLTELLSKKKFIFCVKAKFQKMSHIVRSCHLQPCIFPIHLPPLPNPVSGTFSTQMIYTLPNEQNLQIHPPVWVPGSSKAKASFRVLHSSYISVFTSSKK